MGRLLTENMMHTVAVVSLGCPKNQIDAETMLGLLAEKRYSLLNRPEKAEVIIVNTCGFIDKARKNRCSKFWPWLNTSAPARAGSS